MVIKSLRWNALESVSIFTSCKTLLKTLVIRQITCNSVFVACNFSSKRINIIKTLARHFYCSLGEVSPRSSAGFNHLSNLLLLKKWFILANGTYLSQNESYERKTYLQLAFT